MSPPGKGNILTQLMMRGQKMILVPVAKNTSAAQDAQATSATASPTGRTSFLVLVLLMGIFRNVTLL